LRSLTFAVGCLRRSVPGAAARQGVGELVGEVVRPPGRIRAGGRGDDGCATERDATRVDRSCEGGGATAEEGVALRTTAPVAWPSGAERSLGAAFADRSAAAAAGSWQGRSLSTQPRARSASGEEDAAAMNAS
jgi:hypothetical protein